MGRMVIAVYRPKPGMDAELMDCMRDHLPVLRGQGLATSRPSTILRAEGGILLEVFEWESQEAIDAAHTNPVVLALWDRYAKCCDYGTLNDLAEVGTMFAGFELVEV